MGFPEARARQQTAVFARLGEPGSWTGITDPVQVRLIEGDELASLGETQLILGSLAIKVRRSDVASPTTGDECRLTGSDRLFRVTSDPMLDRNAAWICPVVEVF